MRILKEFKVPNFKFKKIKMKDVENIEDVKVDYVGFNIPDEFVVGYGLDYAQRYRNLPFIGVVEGVE